MLQNRAYPDGDEQAKRFLSEGFGLRQPLTQKIGKRTQFRQHLEATQIVEIETVANIGNHASSTLTGWLFVRSLTTGHRITKEIAGRVAAARL